MTNTVNTDQIHRFLFDDADIRGEVVNLTSSFQGACEHQDLPAAAQRLLGEFLAATSLLSEILKFSGTITLQARGNGHIPLIMADTTEHRAVRGIAKVSPEASPQDLESGNLAQLIGNGVLTLTMDPTKGQRYQGIVELTGSTLSECLTNYFTQSEQLPTRLWLFSDQKQAGGVLLQAMPQSKKGSSPEQWHTAEQLSNTLTHEELFQIDHNTLLSRLFGGEFTIRLFEPHQVQFACQCSRERCANTITTLGSNSAHSLVKERKSIDITCEFCGNQYCFDEADVTAIFDPIKKH